MGLSEMPRAPVRVMRLTPDLTLRLKAQAALAINGEGGEGCSLRAMTTSCFASENCASGHSALHLDMLLASPHAFVALTDVEPNGITPLREDRFVGCVSAAPYDRSIAHTLFATHGVPKALVLSNLCVAEAYRGHGLGRRLVQAVLNIRAPRTFLLIALHGNTHPDADVRQAFSERVPRLERTYKRLLFEQVDTCPKASLWCFTRR